MLLSMSKRPWTREAAVELADDVAFERADDLALGATLRGAPRDVGTGTCIVNHAHQRCARAAWFALRSPPRLSACGWSGPKKRRSGRRHRDGRRPPRCAGARGCRRRRRAARQPCRCPHRMKPQASVPWPRPATPAGRRAACTPPRGSVRGEPAHAARTWWLPPRSSGRPDGSGPQWSRASRRGSVRYQTTGGADETASRRCRRYATASSEISERQRVVKSRRCSASET